MPFPMPVEPPDVEDWLAEQGEVFTVIRGHDSGCTSYGVEIVGEPWFVKAAPPDGCWQLEGALRVHRLVRHPAIVPLVADFATRDGGHAVVYPWVAGENFHDPSVPGALPREDEDSALNRFRRLPRAEALAAYDAVLDAHLVVAACGLVAVDLYDGCLVYDFAGRQMHLVDLDLYTPPYVLELDRQFGSRRLMPPEELVRGSLVDERATVFTLARLADHLGCDEAAGSVIAAATRPTPADRHPTVSAFTQAWREATGRQTAPTRGV